MSKKVTSFRADHDVRQILNGLEYGDAGQFINDAIRLAGGSREAPEPGRSQGTPPEPSEKKGEKEGDSLEAPAEKHVVEGDAPGGVAEKGVGAKVPPPAGNGISAKPSEKPESSSDSTPTSNDSESPSSETENTDEDPLRLSLERLRAMNLPSGGL